MAALGYPIRVSFRKIEIGDVLLFFYALALIRQYLWPVSDNALAWVLTFSISLSFWCFGLIKKGRQLPEDGVSYSFYLIVALPLFVIYAIRFVFPDTSFDVMNYHIIAAERSLRGFPFRPGDFFPIDLPVNPMADMVTGSYRHLLGYRLGTIVNYFNMIWVATILVKFLRAYLKRTWLIYLAVLLILLTETLLFEINNYMVDLLTLPLLLQATYLVLHAKQPKTLDYSHVYIAFLLGLSVALKLTNVVFVLPIALILTQRLFSARVQLKPVPLILLLMALIAPLIPYTLHLYRETGSPVFPFFNSIFKSPYWMATNFKEPAYGPEGLGQMFLWPALMYLKAQRVSEVSMYAGKIPLGFVLAFFLLPFKRIDRNIRALSALMIVAALLWSLTTGYARYALYLELVSGILIIYLSHFVTETLNLRGSLRYALAFFPWALLAILSTFSLYHVSHFEWSGRPTLFDDRRAFLRESKFLFRDYSLKNFLPPEKALLFEDVGVWIKFAPLMSSFEGLLRPDIPAISLRSFVTLETREAKDKLDRAINESREKRMFSLCSTAQLGSAVDFIADRGLGIGKITTVAIPYYSYSVVYNLALVEVLPRQHSESETRPIILSLSRGPLPAAAFQARIESQNLPANLQPGSRVTVYVTVRNTSAVPWPGLGREDGAYKVSLGNHWLDSNGKPLSMDDGRTDLPFDLKPGDTADVPLTVTAPSTQGAYILEIDMVQEQVSWFSAMGSKTLRVNLRVE